MDQQAVNKQIKQMVEFIKQEANEKAHEILIKAEEEFNIEKLRLVEAEKVKVKTEFERKNKQVEIQKRIAYSNEVNASRIKVLQARDEVLVQVKTVVVNELGKLGDPGAGGGYKDLLTKLLLQGLYQLLEPAVVIKCRKSDKGVVEGVLKDAAAQYKSGTGKDVKLDIDSADFLPAKDDPANPCSGGIKLVTPDGKISCDNTLNGRLEVLNLES